jgi:hypothetical protein
LGSPFCLYQLWAFAAPGLRKEEKAKVPKLAALATVLFLAGAAFAYFIAFPLTFQFFLAFSSDAMQPLLAIDRYMSLAMSLVLAFAAAFQLPLVLMFLAAIGLIGPEFLRKNRSYAIVLIFVVAAVLTPPDVMSQIILAAALGRFRTEDPAFLNAYFGSIVNNYLRFRRTNRLWYGQGARGAAVCDLEVDLLLLSFLAPGAELIRSRRAEGWGALNWTLRNHAYLMRNQVLVDEMSDFSPVQLKCMASLSDPFLGSVTASGDLELRTTPWGLRSLDELEWAIPKARLTELSVNYRQSKTLSEISDVLSGNPRSRFLSSRYPSVGPRPALLARGPSAAEAAAWIAGKISEIVERAGKLPSAAVIVPSPAEAAPMAEALREPLAGLGQGAVAAGGPAGLGRGAGVRVLSAADARGLEFEAVFVVRPEDMRKTHPDLYLKMAYLAASRAATYLGFVFGDGVPEEFAHVAAQAAAAWSAPRILES